MEKFLKYELRVYESVDANSLFWAIYKISTENRIHAEMDYIKNRRISVHFTHFSENRFEKCI